MQSSRDSSVWRTLAVAFGDGLAFGAGITLTRSAARLAAPKPMTPDLRSLNARLTEIEQRSIELTGHTRAVGTLPAAGSPLNHKAADAVVQAIDERFTEIGGQIDRRLAELEVKVKIELGALDAQDHALAAGVETRLEGLRGGIGEAIATERRAIDADMRGLRGEIGEAIATERRGIDADMRALRAQMAAVHKDFAGTLARLVDEQITKTVATRLQALEEQLRETVREEARLSGQDQQIAELRQRVESQEGNLLSLVMALGQSCLQAAERIPPAAPPPPPASGGAGGAAVPTEIRVAPAADPDLPGFARAREHKPLWRIPMVSCFLFATGSLLALHYL
jgi:hypothetical protein